MKKIEPIIIDDVNVIECEFFRYSGNHGKFTHYCTYQKDEDGLDTHCDADFNKNCFYKEILRRLKHKEQECEQLRETIKLQNEMQKEVCEEKNKQLDQLKAEIRNRNEKIEELRFSVSDLTNRLCNLNAEKSFRIVDYKQALQEIKEIAENKLNWTADYKTYFKRDNKSIKQEGFKALAEILQKCEVIDE